MVDDEAIRIDRLDPVCPNDFGREIAQIGGNNTVRMTCNGRSKYVAIVRIWKVVARHKRCPGDLRYLPVGYQLPS